MVDQLQDEARHHVPPMEPPQEAGASDGDVVERVIHRILGLGLLKQGSSVGSHNDGAASADL
eukprot:2626634-Prorocentrum_lima.AAC.1